MVVVSPVRLDSMDIAAIMLHIPHRYPFLMIDRVIDIDGDEKGIGIKNVTINEPHFLGHFPARPVMPGVLIIEGMAQTAGVLCVAATRSERFTGMLYFMNIDKAKFRKPVVPGDTIEHHMRKLRRRGNIWRFRGESKVGGTLVAEAELTAMLVEE